MINLLPDVHKKEIRAGRANVVIRNYLSLSIAATLLLSAIVGIAFFTLMQTRSNAQSRVDESVAATADFSDTKQKAEAFRQNLATAKQIVDGEVKYSGLILQIANTIPSGVSLDSLDLSAETIGAPISLSAGASSIERAVALKTSFENHPELYSNVYFENISSGDNTDGGGDGTSTDSYPVQFTVNVTLNKEAL